MPPIGYSGLCDRAVLWEKVAEAESGAPIVDADPVELACRWVEKRDEGVGDNGEAIALDAYVAVARDVPIGSIMARGTIQDWEDAGTGDVSSLGDLYQVVLKDDVPDTRSRSRRRTLRLRRYRGDFPTTDEE